MTAFAGDPPDVADINRRAGTTLAVTNFGAAVAAVETVIDTVVASVISGRGYDVEWKMRYVATAGDTYVIRIREDSLAGVEVDSLVFVAQTSGGYTATAQCGMDWPSPITGNKTFVGTLQRLTGAGNMTPQGGSTFKRRLKVVYED
jgi:hypothetical protein